MSNPRHDNAYLNVVEHTSNPGQVVKVFTHLHDTRALLTVTLADTSQKFTSALLEVAANGESILLDELHPAPGHKLLLEARNAKVRTRFNGVEVDFSLRLLDVSKEGVSHVYRMTLTSPLSYLQRRSHYRVPAGHAKPVNIALRRDSAVIQGRVSDLSVGGAGALFHARDEARLKGGDPQWQCTITLPTGHSIQATFEVCTTRVQRDKPVLVVGGRFVDLAENQHDLIQRFVTTMERQILQKRPR